MKKILQFFISVKNEMPKVHWPSKAEMFKSSVATIIFVLFFGVFFEIANLLIAFLKTLVA